MTSYKTMFPSTYLQQADLQDRDEAQRRVVIAQVIMEKVGDEQKPVLYFQHRNKGMVLNFSNANAIAELYGDEYEGWIGREIVLYVDPAVMFGGKRVGGIRVKAPPRSAGNNNPQPSNKPPPRPPRGEFVTEPRDGYTLSTTRAAADPIERVTGHPTRDPADEEIPF